MVSTKKRFILLVSACLLLVFAGLIGLLCYFGGKSYENKAFVESNDIRKIEYLIKSNSLWPSESKKIELGKLYLEKNDVNQAKFYFSKLYKKDRGFYYDGLLTELGEFKGEYKTSELSNYGRFLNNGEGSLTENSDYSSVIRYFKEGVVPEEKKSYSYIYNLISESQKRTDLNELEKKYLVASELVKVQPKLTLTFIQKLEQISGKTKDTLAIKKDAYIRMGNTQKAFENLEAAISVFPEDQQLLQEGIILAEQNGEAKKAELYRKRLNLLRTIGR